MNIANSARRLLINMGKSLPFAICFVVAITYMEYLYALTFEHFLYFHDYVTLNTPIAFYIANNIFEYDILVVVVTLIISIAIEACKWNLWATCFLCFHLIEKSYFDWELDIWQLYTVITANLVVSLFFTFKGFSILIKKH